MSNRAKPVIAVDVGGTFTDVCLLDPESAAEASPDRR